LKNGGTKLKNMKTNTTLQKTLIKLGVEGYKSILVYYEGSGDSGCIEQIHLHKDEFSEDDFDFYTHWGNGVDLRDSILYDDIRNFVDENILDNIENWYNNEGGRGTVYIKIPSGEYHVNNEIRIVEHVCYVHNDNIFNI
jgi:hypothetical protein